MDEHRRSDPHPDADGQDRGDGMTDDMVDERVERIRDILVGDRVQALEDHLIRVDRSLDREIDALRDEFRRLRSDLNGLLRGEVDSLTRRLGELEARDEKVHETMESLGHRMEHDDEAIVVLAKTQESERQEASSHRTAVEERLEEVEQTVLDRTGALESRVADQAREAVKLTTGITGLAGKVTGLEEAAVVSAEHRDRTGETLNGIQEVLSGIIDRLTAMDGHLAGLDNRLADQEGRLKEQNDRLAGLDEKLAGADKRLAGLDGRLAELDGNLTRLGDRLDDRLDRAAGSRADLERSLAENRAEMAGAIESLVAQARKTDESLSGLELEMKSLSSESRQRLVRHLIYYHSTIDSPDSGPPRPVAASLEAATPAGPGSSNTTAKD